MNCFVDERIRVNFLSYLILDNTPRYAIWMGKWMNVNYMEKWIKIYIYNQTNAQLRQCKKCEQGSMLLYSTRVKE